MIALAFEYLRQNVLRIKIRHYGFAWDFKLSRERSKKTEEVFLVSSRESEGKSKSPPNRKFSLQFGKEEMSTEDKKPCLQGFVPSWSFLTCLRRPLLFRLAGKEGGEKGRLGYVWCFLPLNSGEHQYFRRRSTWKSPHGRLGTRRLIRRYQVCS